MAEQMTEILAIASNPEPASFENTIVAMERTGALLKRAQRVFSNITSTDTNDTLKAVQTEMSPKFSAHTDNIRLNPELFARVQALYEQRDSLGLDAESVRLLERYYLDFKRAGAELSADQKVRFREINTRLAELGTKFGQNVLNEVNDSAVVIDTREELAGLSDNEIESAASEAESRGLKGKFVLTLKNTTQQPPLTSLQDRAVRQRIQEASAARGSRGNEFDNRAIVVEVLKLRSERAQMLGYESHATFALEIQTAKTVDAVNNALGQLAPRAYANARREAADLQELVNATEAEPFEIASWDWLYYTEKLRKQRYDLDANQLKPYFELNRVLEDGVFYMAENLYGLTFEERPELPVYNEDVRVFEAFLDGEAIGLFLFDPYARASKSGGAWMNEYVSQSHLLNDHYPRFSGTSVPRDFVEYPSQVHEMWRYWPEVLSNYAVHYETGEAIPQDLLDKVIAASKFNEGFKFGEQLAAAILDTQLHQLPLEDIPPAEALMETQAKILADAGTDFDAVPPRYSTPYFSHSLGGYSSGYYSYSWSEVLDADSVKWFKENGGLKRENGDHFRNTLLSRGGTEDAMQLFRDFRGADPSIEPLLEKRGLK
jgi:peptidyl-dipeptidase Dcp